MAYKPPATIENIEDFLYEIGEVDKDDVITFGGIEFEVVKSIKGKPKLELVFAHPGTKAELNKFKGAIFKEIRGTFKGTEPSEFNGYKALKFPGGMLVLDPEEDEDAGKGTVPPQVHERGTALVFTRALHSKKPFKSENDLQNDVELTKDLKKVFGTKWEHRRKDWTHSFYEQQQAALKEYSDPSWSEFEYGNNSFVKFFENHIDKLHRDLDPKVPVQRYERWNPSDIWAVKTGRMGELKKELKKQKIVLDVKKWTKSYLKERSKFLFDRNKLQSKNFPIQPKGLFRELRRVLPKNSAITLDAGTLCLQATDSLHYYDPPSLFTPLDFGLVGFSFACGLGVKLAKPNKTVVSLMGDGGFGMTISELSTAVEYKINTITIVMNNKSWGAEKAYQKDFYGKRYLGADISSPRFDKLAELYGAKGFKVTKISEINRTLKSALKIKKPVVIDVDVDPKALYSFRRDSFKHREKK